MVSSHKKLKLAECYSKTIRTKQFKYAKADFEENRVFEEILSLCGGIFVNEVKKNQENNSAHF